MGECLIEQKKRLGWVKISIKFKLKKWEQVKRNLPRIGIRQNVAEHQKKTWTNKISSEFFNVRVFVFGLRASW